MAKGKKGSSPMKWKHLTLAAMMADFLAKLKDFSKHRRGLGRGVRWIVRH